MNISREDLEKNGGQYVTERYRYTLTDGKRVRAKRTPGDGLTESVPKKERLKKWIQETRDRVNLLLPAGYKDRIAEESGTESMTQFIKSAIDKALPMECSGVCPSCSSPLAEATYCPVCGQRLKRR